MHIRTNFLTQTLTPEVHAHISAAGKATLTRGLCIHPVFLGFNQIAQSCFSSAQLTLLRATQIFKLNVQTLIEVAGKTTFTGGLGVLPAFKGASLLKFSLTKASLSIILPVALSVAAISILETLLAGMFLSVHLQRFDCFPPSKLSLALLFLHS